ncbi:pentatricopeptide repeat-containing protein, partial [Tanacetum coccineum]
FFQNIDYESEEGAARYFVNVLLNYLVLMGQINRARCVWKVSYENKLFPKAIVFDQHIAWSLDVRNLSVGAALIAVVHTLHRFRKRMLYYGVVPRRIKLVTGPTLKIVVAQMLSSVESPFEVSKVVLRAPGDSVSEWFKKPIVQQFLLNEIPSRSDILMHKLNILFPSSAPEISLGLVMLVFGSDIGWTGAKVHNLTGRVGNLLWEVRLCDSSGMYDDNKGCQGSMTWTFYMVVDVPSVDGTFNGRKVKVSGTQLCKAEAHGQTYQNRHSILQ